MSSDKDIKEAFSTFDTDNDGSIAASEIGTVIRALGKAPLQSEVDAIEKRNWRQICGFFNIQKVDS